MLTVSLPRRASGGFIENFLQRNSDGGAGGRIDELRGRNGTAIVHMHQRAEDMGVIGLVDGEVCVECVGELFIPEKRHNGALQIQSVKGYFCADGDVSIVFVSAGAGPQNRKSPFFSCRFHDRFFRNFGNSRIPVVVKGM